MHDAGIQKDAARDGPDLASAGPERRKSRRDMKRKSSRDSKKLQKDPERRRTYSFSPGRNDSIRVARDENRPPIPPLPANWKGKERSNIQGPESNIISKPPRASTQPIDNTQEWQRIPTLRKRSAQDLPRRKSSKKRKEDRDREQEIRAMVAFLPTQAGVADAKLPGKLRERESTRMRGNLRRSTEDKSLDVSLLLAESLNSARSDSGNETSFKLTALDMLAPRPTIRYSERPIYVPGASRFVSERSESRMKRISERVPVPEGAMKASRRIDELADDLSAGELRELMERDAKRKEKKKLAERIKAEERIARRQEKQSQEEADAIRHGTPSPDIVERGVMGREVVGLGIGTSAIVTSSKRKGSTGSDSGRGKRPAETFRQETPTGSPIERLNPFSNFHRTASLTSENLTPASDRSLPILEVARVATIGKANVSPTMGPQGHNRGASSISQMIELNKEEASIPTIAAAPILVRREPSQKPPETSNRTPQSWTSFFKLRARNKSGHTSTPSSFSNTSRDSMHAGSPPPGPQFGYQPMRSASTIPKRTMSKFREDLPELPISPPESRVQSPEADVVPPIRTGYPEKRAPSEDPRVRYDTPTSGYRSIEAMRLRDETPTSGHRSGVSSPEPVRMLSQSLASIDSEGSWLSGGRGSKRGSTQVPQHHFHDSSSSLSKKYKEFSESAEELGIAEDEYFSRLTPGPEEAYKIHRQSTGNPMPSSDEEDGGSIASPVASEKSKWGAVGRHPTVVHREPTAMSGEVILNEFEDDAMSGIIDEIPEEPRNTYDNNNDGPDTPDIQRARSVQLDRKHVRNISAGSARMLDLKPRASRDTKRVASDQEQS